MITIEWNSRGEKRPSFHFLAFDSASASAVILIDDLAILVPRDGVGVYARKPDGLETAEPVPPVALLDVNKLGLIKGLDNRIMGFIFCGFQTGLNLCNLPENNVHSCGHSGTQSMQVSVSLNKDVIGMFVNSILGMLIIATGAFPVHIGIYLVAL